MEYHYALYSLHFADIVNAQLEKSYPADLTIDVCGLPWLKTEQDYADYFPGVNYRSLEWWSNPIVSIWKAAEIQSTLIGRDAMDYVLTKLNINTTSHEIHHTVRPPSRNLFNQE